MSYIYYDKLRECRSFWSWLWFSWGVIGGSVDWGRRFFGWVVSNRPQVKP